MQKERAFTSTSFFRDCRVSRLLHGIDGPVGQCSWVLLLAMYFRIRPIVSHIMIFSRICRLYTRKHCYAFEKAFGNKNNEPKQVYDENETSTKLLFSNLSSKYIITIELFFKFLKFAREFN